MRGLCAFAALALLLGEAPSAQQQVSDSGAGAYEASLTLFGSGMAVSWYDTRDGHPEVYARLIDMAGTPLGADLRLTHSEGAAYEPDVGELRGHLVVAWYETFSRTESRAMLGAWTRDGVSLWTTALSPAGRYGRNPVVRVWGDRVFAAWIQDDPAGKLAVWAGWYDGAGSPLAAPRRIASAGRSTWNLNAAIDRRGRAWVAFDADAGTRSEELFLASIDLTSSRVERLTADDGKASKYPDIGFSDAGVMALTWFDLRDGNEEIYLWAGAVKDTARVDRQAHRITHTAGESIGAYVAWNGDRIGLGWCDNSAGQQEIYFQSFDARAAALAPATRLTHTATESLIPAIRPAGDGFLLAWNEFSPGPDGAHDPRGRSEVQVLFVKP